MNVKIIQPAGLGDIFFCLKIAKQIISQGYTVYWPVIPQYDWIRDYIKIDRLIWEDTSDIFECIDIQSAGKIYTDIPIMNAKYKMVEMDSSDWLDYFTFERNTLKELELYNELVYDKPYCLICDTFASPPGMVKRAILKNDEMYNIDLIPISGYTPFDWCKLIEEADELRLVDTCYTYFVEKLNIKAKKLFLYSRDRKAFYTDHIWKKPWIYIK